MIKTKYSNKRNIWKQATFFFFFVFVFSFPQRFECFFFSRLCLLCFYFVCWFFFYFLELRVLLWLVPLDHTVYYTLALILMTTSGNGDNIEELGEEEIHEQESESKRKRIFFLHRYIGDRRCVEAFQPNRKKYISIKRMRQRQKARLEV